MGAGTTDNYFEISKNLEIFSDLYKNINLFYVDDTRPGDLMKQGIDAMLKTLDPYTVYFPDSLIQAFKTSSGRTVYDGRGITPDIAVEKELLGDVVEALAKKHLFFRFANEYVAKYPNIDDPAQFSLSTEDYNWFEDFVHGYDISYTTDTEMRFEELMKIAKEEKYFDDASTEFETLQNKIAHNSDNDLKKFKDQIVEILENEIVSRYFFQNGRVEHALNNDQFIARAKKVFYSSEYMDILNTTK